MFLQGGLSVLTAPRRDLRQYSAQVPDPRGCKERPRRRRFAEFVASAGSATPGRNRPGVRRLTNFARLAATAVNEWCIATLVTS